MHTSLLGAAALLPLLSYATPIELATRATPTLYLAGDSTMARLGANDGNTDAIEGWGQYLQPFVNITVVNKAIGGRSARSYFNEGRFAEIAGLVKSDDIVVIEFGHNDGGSPNSASDNGRSDCPGTADETCKSGKTGETVYTFNYYVTTAAKNMTSKGAKVIVSSQTPNNVWESGTYSYSAGRFVDYAATAAKNVGAGASFVDHGQAVADAYKKAGKTTVQEWYPKDHTHTSPAGAKVVAQAFAQAIDLNWNGTTPLKAYVKSPVVAVF